MNFLRNHWFDIGGVLGLILLSTLSATIASMTSYQALMWLSLCSLFFHQVEEYRMPGTFPGMINSNLFHSKNPDRYPLNTNTSFIINVLIGWSIYILAALLGTQFVWLGMAAIMISLGNIIAHTFLFNIKGKTIYNAGLITSWLFLAPCVYFFFKIIYITHLASVNDYIIGILLGMLVNVFGVLKPITWLANENTNYIFKNRQLLAKDRR